MSSHGFRGHQQVPEQIRYVAAQSQEYLTDVFQCAYSGAYNASLLYYRNNWPSMMANMMAHVQSASKSDQAILFTKLSSIEELVALQGEGVKLGSRTIEELSSEIHKLNHKVENNVDSSATTNATSSTQDQTDLRDINHSIRRLEGLLQSEFALTSGHALDRAMVDYIVGAVAQELKRDMTVREEIRCVCGSDEIKPKRPNTRSQKKQTTLLIFCDSCQALHHGSCVGFTGPATYPCTFGKSLGNRS